ncbi:unnamed protein product [Mytilus coruscus]|uniref:DUF7869 domain-containing protein n=1 Tax=Mytilus coruscus TaxID=42192 RepID=A0A6J8CJ77_MYTCO|nr:unnamed protein product [Mytilus coruscus]
MSQASFVSFCSSIPSEITDKQDEEFIEELHIVDELYFAQIESSQNNDGLAPRVHGGKGRHVKHALEFTDTDRNRSFLHKYAVDNALSLPGRLPNFRNSQVLLLPSDKTAFDIHELYEKLAVEMKYRSVSVRTFQRLWSELSPNIVVSKPCTDLCCKCQDYAFKISNSGHPTEEEKRKQTFYLVDEEETQGKGANSVVSRVHHYLMYYGHGETNGKFHFDNCSGQNKTMLYCGLHKSIEYSMMIVGHTKFEPDWHFRVWKVKWRNSTAETMTDIADSVNKSSRNVHNISQLVKDMEKPVIFYDWKKYLQQYFKTLKHISTYRHFTVDSTKPGYVVCKESCDSVPITVNLLKKNTIISTSTMPNTLTPKGLDAATVKLHIYQAYSAKLIFMSTRWIFRFGMLIENTILKFDSLNTFKVPKKMIKSESSTTDNDIHGEIDSHEGLQESESSTTDNNIHGEIDSHEGLQGPGGDIPLLEMDDTTQMPAVNSMDDAHNCKDQDGRTESKDEENKTLLR